MANAETDRYEHEIAQGITHLQALVHDAALYEDMDQLQRVADTLAALNYSLMNERR